MNYMAKILSLNDNIEEEVEILIKGNKLVCFASCCPHPVYVGNYYNIELLPIVFDDYEVTPADNSMNEGLERIKNTFSYKIIGYLCNGVISVNGLRFYDDFIHTNYGYLNDKKVCWTIDRLDIDFQ